MRKLPILALLSLIGSPVFAQTSKTGRITVGTLANLPINCSPGDQYTANDQTPPQAYICGPTNVWNLQGSAGSSGGIINTVLTATGASSSTFQAVGLPLGNGNADVTSCPYIVKADNGTTTLDRGTVIEVLSATACTITLPDPSTSGMGNFFALRFSNIGAGPLTVVRQTSATMTVLLGGSVTSGATSFSLNTGQFATIHSDNANWHVEIPPQGISSSVPARNVNITNTTSYTVTNGDNLWDDKFTAASAVAVTLPKASSITSAPFVATRYSNQLGACTTCSPPAYAQSAGDFIHIYVGYLTNGVTVTGISDTAGDTFVPIQAGILDAGTSFGSNSYAWLASNVNVSASNTLTITFSGSTSPSVSVLEYTGLTGDHSASCVNQAPSSCSVTMNVSYTNEVAIMGQRTAGGGSSCPSGWQIRGGGLANGFQVCEQILNAVSSVVGNAAGGSFNDSAIHAADFGIAGSASFTAGWEFYVENATSPCSPVTITPTTSTINTSSQTGLTSFIVPCNMTARLRSDGTNYELMQLDGTNGQVLTSTYTNATTGFTSTALTFPMQAGQTKFGSCHLTYQGTATTAAPILQFTGPASPTTITANLTETLTSGSSPTFYSASTTGSTFAIGLGATAIVSTATDMPMVLDLGITNGSTAGTVTLQAKSNGAGTITFEKGSTCVLY